MVSTASPIERHSASAPGMVSRSFYLSMSLLIAVATVYGFSQTITENLIRPAIPRPWILYVHAALSFAWVVLFAAQTALIQTRKVLTHRRLGLAGLVIGSSIPIVGIATALTMAQFNILHGLRTPDHATAFLAIPINDMIGFTVSFALAIWWRRTPEYHRRLMLIATCCLTAAVFVRFPLVQSEFPMALRWYAGADALVLLGAGRDLLMTRRIHPVYLYGLPLLVLGQTVAMTMFLARVPVWMTIANRLIT